MKYLLILLLAASCKKSSPELSQREKELTEPLLENQIIEDGAVRILIYSTATIELSGIGLQTTQTGLNYTIEDMEENSQMFIDITFTGGSGTFDVMAEGFTASSASKRFWIKGLAVGSGKRGFMKVRKGVVKYEFTIL